MSKYFTKFVKYFQDEEKLAQNYLCECKSKNIENDNTKLEELTSSDSSSSSEQEFQNQNQIIKLINENQEWSCEEYGSDEEYDQKNDDLCREWYQNILFERIEKQEQMEIQQLVLFHNVQNLLQNESLMKLHQNKQYLEVTNNIKDPQIILDYINLIWTDLTDPQVLILHIEILSEFNPTLVPEFLKQDKYPIEILQITKKFNIQEGCAFLFLKQGMLSEALDKLIEFVDDQMRYYVREQLRLPVQIQKKRKSIYKFKSVSQLIVKLQQVLQQINDFLQSNKYIEDMDILWFKYFHKMIDWQFWLDQLYKLQNTKVELIQLMNFVRVNIPNTVFQLIQSTDIDLFIEEYQLSFNKLNIATHMFNFKQITREQKYHKKILKLCFNEIQCTNQMIKEILAIRKQRGRRIQIQCSECSLFGHMIPINSNQLQNMIIYQCGHLYHQSCIRNIVYCNICQMDDMTELLRIDNKVKSRLNQILNELQFVQKTQSKQPQQQQYQQQQQSLQMIQVKDREWKLNQLKQYEIIQQSKQYLFN